MGVRQFSSKGDEKGPKTIRINTLADGADPVELPDSEYPEWLWTITGDRPSESELLDKGLDNLTLEEQTTCVFLVRATTDKSHRFVCFCQLHTDRSCFSVSCFELTCLAMFAVCFHCRTYFGAAMMATGL